MREIDSINQEINDIEIKCLRTKLPKYKGESLNGRKYIRT